MSDAYNVFIITIIIKYICLILHIGCFACMCVCASRAWLVPMEIRIGHQIHWHRVIDEHELPSGCWDPNLGCL